jgi:hypothetical protein
MTVRKKAKVANFMQALGQNVKHEPAQEFHRVEGLGAQLASAFVVFEAEGNLTVLQSDQAVVGDRHPVGVAS